MQFNFVPQEMFFIWSNSPPVDLDLLIHKVSISHITHHSP